MLLKTCSNGLAPYSDFWCKYLCMEELQSVWYQFVGYYMIYCVHRWVDFWMYGSGLPRKSHIPKFFVGLPCSRWKSFLWHMMHMVLSVNMNANLSLKIWHMKTKNTDFSSENIWYPYTSTDRHGIFRRDICVEFISPLLSSCNQSGVAETHTFLCWY